MFNKILACMDGSELAEQILPYVKAQAKSFESTVVLLHVTAERIVTMPGLPGAPGSPIQTRSMLKGMEQEMFRADEYLDKLVPSFEELGIPTKYEVLEGPVGETIVRYAKDNEIDLIALASHGRSGIDRAIMGSVADYVLRKAGLPILIIRPQQKTSRAEDSKLK